MMITRHQNQMQNSQHYLIKLMDKFIKSRYIILKHIKHYTRQLQMDDIVNRWIQINMQFIDFVLSYQQIDKLTPSSSITILISNITNLKNKQKYHKISLNQIKQNLHMKKQQPWNRPYKNINNLQHVRKHNKIIIIFKLFKLIKDQLLSHIFKLLLFCQLVFINFLLLGSFWLISNICEMGCGNLILYFSQIILYILLIGYIAMRFFQLKVKIILGDYFNIQLMSQQPIPIKLVIVGDGSVGKTCILVSYTENKFPTGYEPTVFDNFSTTLKIDNKIVNLGLWDTAGQQQYNRLRPLAYPHCDVFLICFSVIDPPSFLNAKKKWFPELEECVPKAPKIFIGNKIDLREEYQRKCKDPKSAPIAKQTARKIIQQEMKCKYIECSALTQEGLKQIFTEAVRMVLKTKTSSGKSRQTTRPDQGTTCKCNLF